MRSALAVLVGLVVALAVPAVPAVADAPTEEAVACVAEAGEGAADAAEDEAPAEDEDVAEEPAPGEADEDLAAPEDALPTPIGVAPATTAAKPQPLVEAEEDPIQGEDALVLSAADAVAGQQASISAEAEAASPALPMLGGRGYLRRHGWRAAKAGSAGGIVLGTTGRGVALEALKLSVKGGSVVLRARAQRDGGVRWGTRVRDGMVGSPGGGRLEAVQIWLSGGLERDYDVLYRVHVQEFGWMGWARSGAYAGTSGFDKRIEAIEVRVAPKGAAMPGTGSPAAYRDAGITAQAHVQSLGWMRARTGNTVTIGTRGRSLRLEALRIRRPALDLSGDVVTNAWVQKTGWQGRRGGARVAGTEGKGRRIEALSVRLTGALGERYDIWYRLYVQGIGWMGWARNGQKAGAVHLSLRTEAVQLALRRKGATAPAPTDQAQEARYVDGALAGISYGVTTSAGNTAYRSDGATVGSGKGTPITSVFARSSTDDMVVWCSAHQGSGWTDYVAEGAQAGSGKARVDAVRMRLSGSSSALFSVWYRAYVKGVGWTLWARDGEDCGTLGRGLSVVALQARIVSRRGQAPSDAAARVATTCVDARFPQLLRSADARQRRLVRSANTTPWPGPALCAGWVEDVYARAGRGTVMGNACDLYDRYCRQSDPAKLKVGMIVAVRSHPHTTAGSIWGHVGIYVGDGWIMDSVGIGVRTVRLSWWTDHYGATCTPRWGWLG